MDTICTITTSKAPLQQTISHVNYHLSIGVDKVLMYFDDENDPALEILQHHDQVICTRCNDNYWKSVLGIKSPTIHQKLEANANSGLNQARALGIDWVIHIDVDELVYPSQPLKKVLSESGCDVLRFEGLEGVPERETYTNVFVEQTLFRTPPVARTRKLATVLGCKKSFYYGTYFRGHLTSKSAVRTTAEVQEMGCHVPKKASEKVLTKYTSDVKLLHFDCCGFNSWRDKWIRRFNDPKSVWDKRREHRVQQFRDFLNAYESEDSNGSMLTLYKRLYYIPAYEIFVLRLLHLLIRIRVEG